jgi:SpoVK/Ycf46/Vps4 family AAA+-type ATPase
MSETEVAPPSELDNFNSLVGTGNTGGGRARTAGHPSSEEEGDEEDGKAKDASMWAKQGVSYFPCDEAVAKLAPGQYEICSSQSAGIYFKMTNGKFDDLIELPDSASEAVIAEIQKFWTKEPHFRRFGFLWKRGILLWGPPGSGKTCCLQQVSQNIIDAGGIAVYASHPGVTAAGLGIMRRIEPDRPIVVMMEDLDALVQQYGEQDVLALLDGELQIDNVVFIATTNYPERLDKRIVNRPSRFDLVKLIDMPNEEARKVYLQTKNHRLQSATVACKACGGTGAKEVVVTPAVEFVAGVTAVEARSAVPAVAEVRDEEGNVTVEARIAVAAVKGVDFVAEVSAQEVVMGEEPCGPCNGSGGTLELDDWVKATDRYSIAHLKELIVSVEVFEVSLEFALKRLGQMLDSVPKSTDVLKPQGQYN